ncbi:hypothetical protein INT45_010712 [Circinella minor]|uniref:Reverse transcriptase domain-containing protein n=1 Tax=Circinella minor TaxID=1195481 RepID=A0A8H7RSP3_9FUNG|nr:hypothetical protein INT45_010712 [Circinella minor]
MKGQAREEPLVLDTNPNERNTIILWPAKIQDDGSTMLFIANCGKTRLGIKAGDIVRATKSIQAMASHSRIREIEVVMKELAKLTKNDGKEYKKPMAIFEQDNVEIQSINMIQANEYNVDSALINEQRKQMNEVLQQHGNRFANLLAEVGELKVTPYEIQIQPDARPVKVPPFVAPVEANRWLKTYLGELERLGFIESCSGPWAAGAVLVPSDPEKRIHKSSFKAKPLSHQPRLRKSQNGSSMKIWVLQANQEEDTEENSQDDLEYETQDFYATNYQGEPPHKKKAMDVHSKQVQYNCIAPLQEVAGKKDLYRLCISYKALNKVLVDMLAYPLPNINQLFTLMAGAKYFTVMDAMKGYWQLPIAEKSRDLTGFVTSSSQKRWCRLVMGMRTSPGVWQSIMDDCFHSALFDYCIIFVDDIMIFSNSWELHLQHVKSVLAMAEKINLSLSQKKCMFRYDNLSVLGHHVGKEGFIIEESKG